MTTTVATRTGCGDLPMPYCIVFVVVSRCRAHTRSSTTDTSTADTSTTEKKRHGSRRRDSKNQLVEAGSESYRPDRCESSSNSNSKSNSSTTVSSRSSRSDSGTNNSGGREPAGGKRKPFRRKRRRMRPHRGSRPVLVALLSSPSSPSSSFSFSQTTIRGCSAFQHRCDLERHPAIGGVETRHHRNGTAEQLPGRESSLRAAPPDGGGGGGGGSSARDGSETKDDDIGDGGEDDRDNNNNNNNAPPNRIVCSGGGIFFYHQAGVIEFLRDRRYDLSGCAFAGASAGALTATLAATGVDFYRATELALRLAGDAGVWNRPAGLQGIWGPLIEEWLDDLLPPAADELLGDDDDDYSVLRLADDRIALLVTPVPSFGKTRVSRFENRADLIRCNMASVHLPWFLDGKLTAEFRGRPHIDGSFLAKEEDYLPKTERRGCDAPTRTTIVLDWKDDPELGSKGGLDIVEALSPEGIYGLLEQGKRYGRIMEDRGAFRNLEKLT